jgi:transcription elongation factor GreA
MGSPIGRALLGKGVGETAILKLPTSVRRLKVIELQTIHQQPVPQQPVPQQA